MEFLVFVYVLLFKIIYECINIFIVILKMYKKVKKNIILRSKQTFMKKIVILFCLKFWGKIILYINALEVFFFIDNM